MNCIWTVNVYRSVHLNFTPVLEFLDQSPIPKLAYCEISPPASGWRVLLFPTRADLGCIGRWHHLMSICCTLGMAWAPSCAYMYCTCVSLFDHTTSMCVFVLFIDNSQGNKRWKLCVRNMQAILFHPLVFHAQFLIDCRYVMNSFTDRCVKRLVTLLSYYARLWSLKFGSLYTSR